MSMTELSGERFLGTLWPAPTIRNVKKGDIIKIQEYDPEIKRESEIIPWKVQKVYPYFAYATCKKRHKCINYGTLVHLGIESGF